MQTKLRTLAAFNAYLGSFPRPEQVMSALIRGPLATYSARSGIMMHAASPSELTLVSHVGHLDAELARYRTFPINVDVPFTRAFREQVIMITEAHDIAQKIPAYSIDANLWATMLERLQIVQFVTCPIVGEGASMGSFSFTVPHELAWMPIDDEFMHALSSSLGLWMSNSRSQMDSVRPNFDVEIDLPLSITERQLRILLMVEQGKCNDSIARALGYSLSTVKAELRLVCRVLRAHDRHDAVVRARELSILAA